MKKYIFLFLLTITSTIYSQVITPSLSPISKVHQRVGLTDIEIEYSRPAVKSRTIFGGVVPYNKIWRTGANKNTTISFSKDVSFYGKIVKKGKYAIYTIPYEVGWRLILYNEIENNGMPIPWDKNKVILDVIGQSYDLPFSVESFQISFDNIKSNSATLSFSWANKLAGFSFEVFTSKQVFNNIKEILYTENATTWDYHNSALYYFHNGLDINKSKDWFDKSLSMRKGDFPYWVFAYKAQIYNRYGDKKTALKAAKKSLNLAKKTGNHHAIGMAERALKDISESILLQKRNKYLKPKQ
ncbi:MAG: DUF2911 domain-containing protein [Flavobacteriaceae bacterium]|nr:DUF2911 domain-containing protein [Flavobacteriaceae bacterium]